MRNDQMSFENAIELIERYEHTIDDPTVRVHYVAQFDNIRDMLGDDCVDERNMTDDKPTPTFERVQWFIDDALNDARKFARVDHFVQATFNEPADYVIHIDETTFDVVLAYSQRELTIRLTVTPTRYVFTILD